MAAVLSGEAAVTFPNLPAAVPHVRSGKLRPLAVTSARRSQSLPDIPSVAESGFPGYDLAGWLGVAAPAGTPPQIVNRLHRDFAAVLTLPDTQTKFIHEGADPIGSTPAEFGAYVERQIARLRKIGIAAGVKLQ
jgi:tripartite-type tricarboxylate transporter receptor subunit TctC